MTENSLEFQPMPGDNQEDETVRYSFRVPASDQDELLAVFYDKTYNVINLSPMGIAIYSDSYMDFESGQILDDGVLVLGRHRISGLSAKVVHCSINDSGGLQFGLSWLNLDPEVKNYLDTFLDQMKTRVLKKGQLSDKES